MDSRYWFVILAFVFLILYLLVKNSQYFHFKLKYFAYNCSLILLPLYGLFVGLLRPGNPDNFHRFAGTILYLATRMFNITVATEGTEHLDRDKIKSNFIIVSNHQSSLDMFCIMKLCPHDTTFVAKKELIYTPIFGQAAWLCGTVFVERKNARSARGAMDSAVKRIKSEKMNLWIFPEGTRRQVGTLLPFKKGAFHVAQQAQIPIIPVVVSNYDDIFSKKTLTFKSGTIKVTVLPPVSTEGLTPDDVTDLTDKVRQQMLEVFHKKIPNENTENELKEKSD